ncbi:MAG: acyl-ACP desaturase [Deltaproteobacteria bacterium]|nr:acyl-ACP desaturase [Deltaproteobacteria bacterium]
MSESAVAVAAPETTTPEIGFRALYRNFFDHAEKKRRWNVVDGIPWADVKHRAVDEDLVEILEAFYSVEMYLPDYSSKLIALNRQNHGMAWFLTNWCYEESKHSMVIEEWLIRSGRRTPQEMERLNDRLLSAEWNLPFETPRRMLIYSMFQELATQLNYVNLSKLTSPAGDPALQKLILLIASDEGLHHRMFVDCVKEYLTADRTGTVDDIAFVLQHFEMPAHDLIPDWQRKGEMIERHRIYGGRQFVMRVLLPTLKALELDRKELQLSRTRAD